MPSEASHEGLRRPGDRDAIRQRRREIPALLRHLIAVGLGAACALLVFYALKKVGC